MAAEFPEKCRVLADKIAGLLGDEIQVGSDVVEYVNSTYGNPGFDEIKTLIEEPGGSDRETLVELIFFPDEAIQLQLEEVLEQNTYTSEDVAAIAAQLAARSIRAAVSLEPVRPRLHLQVDRTVIDPFLTRLNIDYALEESLCRSVADILPTEKRRAVRVRLRNHRAQPVGRWLAFLNRYIRQACGDGFFFEGLDFLLEFVQETDSGVDIFEALMRKKRRCRRLLNKGGDVEQKLRKTNVETLLLQGGRFPHIDRGRTLKTIAIIDRICLALFGKTEPIEAAGTAADSWEFRDAEDAAAMIRLLSS